MILFQLLNTNYNPPDGGSINFVIIDPADTSNLIRSAVASKYQRGTFVSSGVSSVGVAIPKNDLLTHFNYKVSNEHIDTSTLITLGTLENKNYQGYKLDTSRFINIQSESTLLSKLIFSFLENFSLS